jgi:hypothetical protein
MDVKLSLSHEGKSIYWGAWEQGSEENIWAQGGRK